MSDLFPDTIKPSRPQDFPPQLAPLSLDARGVAMTMALLWAPRTQTDVHTLARGLGQRRGDGRAYSADDVKQAVAELRGLGLLVEETYRPGQFRLHDDLRVPLYRHLLDTCPGEVLRKALYDLERFDSVRTAYYWPVRGTHATVAILRVMLFTGMPKSAFLNFMKLAGQIYEDWPLLQAVALEGFDAASFRRIDPELQGALLYEALYFLGLDWSPALLPARDFALARLDREPETLPDFARLALADHLLQCGDWPRFERALAGLDGGAVDALRASRGVLEGQFEAARPLWEAALKRRQVEVSARKRLLPDTLAWYYPLCLLARPSPAHLEAARKFCLGESGKKAPPADSDWGRWAHAVTVRTGQAELNRAAFVGTAQSRPEAPGLGLFWRVLLAAWLGEETLRLDAPARARLDGDIHRLAERFQQCGLSALLAQLEGARTVLHGGEPPAGLFIGGRSERWRDVLASLRSLAGDGPGAGQATDKADSRLIWTLALEQDGSLLDVVPLEQKRGARGWGKPRAISAARVAGNAELPPHDARVARCLRPDPFASRAFTIDRAAAIVALVGHPHVALAEHPEQFAELAEGSPELEVIRNKDGFKLRVSPSPHPASRGIFFESTEEHREAEALRFISVLRDSPQRLRLVRLNEAQRRAAQLLGRGFSLPAEAQEALRETLQGLARQFQVLGDSDVASREVPAEPRLRAELATVGQGLSLRLVAAPLGEAGPRLKPAAGRTRVIAMVEGETVGTRRDLAVEQSHLDALFDALPFLAEADPDEHREWLLEDPEQALAAVEALPGLPGMAGVDWPKGKRVRVVGVDGRRLGVKVSGDKDWFRLEGQARLDDGLVVAFETLLEAARGKSRYIPIGDGVYAALTRSLKTQLAELAAVAEPTRHGARLPKLAAGWLADTLEGLDAEGDADFRAAVERLRAAQDSQPVLPGTLQAELRPYQEDGYQWAMRLAQAGFGACLADDMGLGKTLQALAVMLARAPAGAALVVAPTSVCGNWLAEIRRFAPSLNAHIYGEAEREELLARAGPLDVVIVSYTLLQQAGERFAARDWHTLVADEAQAVKNAAAKRSRALFELNAEFRLALSGTPVENRLAELWSIMRFANPGLLGNEARFAERFGNPIERGRDREAQHRLRRLIAPFVLRRTKAQVLRELPERTELTLDIVPDAAEAAHYEALRREAVAQVEASLESGNPGVARFNILAQLTRLRRAACDPRLVSPEISVVGAKVQAFAELAAELTANGHKALVFSQFVDFLQLLRVPLEAAGIAYQYLDGATPAAERTRRVAAFQSGQGALFLISLKAGGFGLNLTAADYVVITDPWWNPAAEDQAMGRAHRMGQQRPVTVYRLVIKGSIEERILELHADKRALAEGVLSGEETATLPDTEDLLALMRGT